MKNDKKSNEETLECAVKVAEKSIGKVETVDKMLIEEEVRSLGTDERTDDELVRDVASIMLEICKEGHGREFLDFLNMNMEEMNKKGRPLTDKEKKKIFNKLRKGV